MNKYLMCFPKENERTTIYHLLINRWLKLTLLSILLFFYTPGASAQKINLKTNSSSLESVLKSVGSQVSYVFFYKKEEIKSVNKITVDLKAVPLKQALNTILAGTDFEYEIFEKTIVVKKKPASTGNLPFSGDSVQLKAKTQRLIKGRVTDENRLPLSKITVMELATDQETKTNARGEFTLQVQQKGSLAFVGEGFSNYVTQYTDSTTFLTAIMETEGIDLKSVNVSSTMQKKEPARFIDMKNRNYMNLSQVLQGTVPGLSLQIVSTSTKEVTSVDAVKNTLSGFVRYSVEEFLAFYGRAKGQAIIDQLLSGRNVPTSISNFYRINTITRTTSALVPQIRGANSFTSDISSMLVVIDGFPQDGFPADLPMTNVESIEVIKDQAELIKWGPKAAGGAILIKTKAAKKGKIQVNYSSNFYYSAAPKFNREKLGLASTSDYLDYLKDVDASFPITYASSDFNYTPARRLFAQKRQNLISQSVYEKSLDSLKGLNNEEQMKLLQENKFSQNHTIGLNGGTNIYKFNFIGNYFDDKKGALKSYDKTASFSLNNEINLLKNKLNISWLINYSNAVSRGGYSFNPNAFEPYQMLLDEQGNYVYDYTNLSPQANATIQSYGYKNYGVNVLEDATINKNLSRRVQKKTRFNFRWNLLPGLTWSTSALYDGSTNKTNNFYDKESSYVRRLVNTYGVNTPTGVNFYVPYGDVLQMNNTKGEEWNVRSSLAYAKTIGKHAFSITAGGGAANVGLSRPNTTTMYGYNSETKTAGAVFLPVPNPNAGILNFYSLLPNATGSTVYPYMLTSPVNGDTTLSRNINGNASLSYRYTDRLRISGTYSNVYNPLYGQSSNYTTSSTYGADVTGLVLKGIGKYLQNVSLSAGLNGVKMPDLPAFYNNIRYQQTTWRNYAIQVNGLVPTQQIGQSSKTYYQRLTFDMLDSVLFLNVAYNTQKIDGSLSALSADPAVSGQTAATSTTSNYASGGLKVRARKGLLAFQLDYSKSPEGESQVNGSGGYDLSHESYFHSGTISMLNLGFKIQSISAFQGLGLMMGTNAASGGSYSQATNSDFSLLPPKNMNYEMNVTVGLDEDRYTMDLRYYNQSTSGLNNNVPVLTDPATGLTQRVTYSKIKNKGVELYLKTQAVKSDNFEYNVILNGAYNVSTATEVPITSFTGSDSYTNAYRNGYNTSSLFLVQSAGLNNLGDPQIVNGQGNVTSVLDSANIVSSMVYSGVTRAPWTGGFIHELSYKSFFARASFVFNFGHVMRTYMPYPSNNSETNIRIKDRWRNPGDEAFTDIPRMVNASGNSYRSFVARNGTNSVMPADNVRFQEIVVGSNLPDGFVKKLGLSTVTIAFQMQNIALWTKNKLHVDPSIVGSDGRIGLSIPKQYSCNISIGF